MHYASTLFSDPSYRRPTQNLYPQVKENCSLPLSYTSLRIPKRIPAGSVCSCTRPPTPSHTLTRTLSSLTPSYIRFHHRPLTTFSAPVPLPHPGARYTAAVDFSPPTSSLSPSHVHACQQLLPPDGKLNEIAMGWAVNDWVGQGRRAGLLGNETGHRWKKHGGVGR